MEKTSNKYHLVQSLKNNDGKVRMTCLKPLPADQKGMENTTKNTCREQ
jgi:hypothetical protein